MDGIEATRRLHGEIPSILIFGLSIQPRPSEVHAIEEAGAAGYFLKGVDMPRLIDQLLVSSTILGWQGGQTSTL